MEQQWETAGSGGRQKLKGGGGGGGERGRDLVTVKQLSALGEWYLTLLVHPLPLVSGTSHCME